MIRPVKEDPAIGYTDDFQVLERLIIVEKWEISKESRPSCWFQVTTLLCLGHPSTAQLEHLKRSYKSITHPHRKKIYHQHITRTNNKTQNPTYPKYHQNTYSQLLQPTRTYNVLLRRRHPPLPHVRHARARLPPRASRPQIPHDPPHLRHAWASPRRGQLPTIIAWSA